MIGKIVAASDSFKGSLSSMEVADAIERAVGRVFPDCEIVKVPVADGGEGTVEALSGLSGAQAVCCAAHDALGREVSAGYVILDNGTTAVIESAAACGLTLLSAGERDPMVATTYGVGEIIGDAVRRGCRRFVVGIGGSATNDGGTGMLSALGFRFTDAEGCEVPARGGELRRIRHIDESARLPELDQCRFEVACDVDNPFTGPAGAACVFAPQKGADANMVEMLDAGMRSFASVVKEKTGTDLDKVPGSGAAGGLGGAFFALLGGKLAPGIDTVLDAVGFDRSIAGADLVITGEGRMDSQTLRGKAPTGVLRRARRQGIPVVAICGGVEDADLLTGGGFAAVFPVVPGVVSLDAAMESRSASANVERTVYNIMKIIETFRP